MSTLTLPEIGDTVIVRALSPTTEPAATVSGFVIPDPMPGTWLRLVSGYNVLRIRLDLIVSIEVA